MATYPSNIDPDQDKTVLYGQWLQLLIEQHGITDPNLQPSTNDSASVVLSKILAVYQEIA